MLAPAIVNVVQLTVQKIALTDRPNLDFALNPVSAAASHLFLLQAVGQLQAFVFNFESFFVGFFRVKRGDKAWLTKQKPKRLNAIKLLAQSVVSVNSEIGGNDGQFAVVGSLDGQKVRNVTSGVVVFNAMMHCGWSCCHLTFFFCIDICLIRWVWLMRSNKILCCDIKNS